MTRPGQKGNASQSLTSPEYSSLALSMSKGATPMPPSSHTVQDELPVAASSPLPALNLCQTWRVIKGHGKCLLFPSLNFGNGGSGPTNPENSTGIQNSPPSPRSMCLQVWDHQTCRNMDSPLASRGREYSNKQCGEAKDSVKAVEDCPDRAGMGSIREYWRTLKVEANMQLPLCSRCG